MSDIRDLLPALSLRRRGDNPALTLRDIDVCLDGVPVKGLESITLSMTGDDINKAVLYLGVRDVEIDGDVLAVLEAHVKERAES